MVSGKRVGGRVAHIASRVSNLELLFDLVFVFTITQVTEILVEHPDWLGLGRAVVLIALVYYMYDGFIWLMNQTAPDTPVVRVVLIAAMATFLVVAAAIPEAFGEARLVFGIGYLLIVTTHLALFVTLGSDRNVRGILRAGRYNLLGAVLTVVAAFVPEEVAWLFVPAAVLVILLGTLSSGRRGFELGAAHMVERHGLLMIIALGESIVAIGAGIAHEGLDARGILFTALAVAIVGGMWWVYFVGDDARVERSFEGADVRRRTSLAMTAFFGDHLAMMFGLVGFAAGIRLSIPEPFEPAAFPAGAFLGGGVALFLLGSGLFRAELRLGGWAARFGGCTGAVLVGAIGSLLPAPLELALLLVVVIATCAASSRRLARIPAES